MPQAFDTPGLECPVGSPALLAELAAGGAAPLPPFDDAALNFLDSFSRELLRTPDARAWPDLAALAFWCRRAHLSELRAEHSRAGELRLGRGLALHIAPGNVALNFAYSLAAGLLAGCACAVRLPSRRFQQTDLALQALARVCASPAQASYARRVVLFRCSHDHPALAALAAGCDARVVWGGDATVRALRALPAKARAVEVAFADRVSLALLDADAVAAASDAELAALVTSFYNDTYPTDQNACTSPRIVCWTGGQIDAAQARFWPALEAYAAPRYPLAAVQAVEKRAAFLRLAASRPGVRLAGGNLVTRALLPALDGSEWGLIAPGGYFMEAVLPCPTALAPLLTARCQTVACYGPDPRALAQELAGLRAAGPDRIQPVGRTLDFDLVWDGIDLIAALSRRVTWG